MLEVLVLQEYFKFNVFLCSSFKITAIHHSHRVTADEVNAGLRLLSDAEENHFQKDSGGTFGMRFSQKYLISSVQECHSSSGLPLALTREDVWSADRRMMMMKVMRKMLCPFPQPASAISGLPR